MAYSTKGVILAVVGGSDYRRWNGAENLKVSWDARTQLIATLVPARSRVIEFGAGKRELERHLDSTCSYLASDIVDRGPGTFICDLNIQPLPDLAQFDVDTAVFSGVLEYLHDLPRVFTWLGGQVRRCVFSYHCARSQQNGFQRWLERLRRTGHGWFNALSREELETLWMSAGFVRVNEAMWRDQTIFVIERPATR